MPLPSRPRRVANALSAEFAAMGWLAGVVFIGLCAFDFWTVASSGADLRLTTAKRDFYNLLVESFLDGRLSLPVTPDPDLLALPDPYDPVANAPYRIPGVTHDLSLFEGRYYIYFGVVPAVVFFLPYRLITGAGLPIEGLVSWCAAGGTLLLTLALGGLLKLSGLPRIKPFAAVTILVVGWGNWLPFILRRAAIYEAAVVAGLFFVALGLWAGVRAVEHRSLFCLTLASLSVGLAVGCRPIHLPALLIPAFVFRTLLSRPAPPPLGRCLMATAIPVGLVLAGLLAYNYARFGDVREFGQNHFLYDYPRSNNRPAAGFVPFNLWIQLFSAPALGHAFPFVRLEPQWVPTVPAGHLVIDPVAGLFFSAPLGLLCFAAPLIPRSLPLLRSSALGLLGVGLLTASMVATFPGVSARYALDSGPYLLSAALLFWSWIFSTLRHRFVAVLSGIAIGLGMCVSTLVSFTGNSDWLRQRNPATYARIEALFRPIQRAWFDSQPGRYGPARVRLRFREGMEPHDEVVLAAGGLYRHNALCVAFLGPRRLRFRFHQRGGNPPLESVPLRFEPGRTYALDIEMGSLYPVSRNTLEKLYPGRGLFRRAEELRVSLDGEEILHGFYDFVPSPPEKVTLGVERVDPQYCALPFSGEILSVERTFP